MLKTCLRIALENNLKNKQDALKKTNWKIIETLISYWKVCNSLEVWKNETQHNCIREVLEQN